MRHTSAADIGRAQSFTTRSPATESLYTKLFIHVTLFRSGQTTERLWLTAASSTYRSLKLWTKGMLFTLPISYRGLRVSTFLYGRWDAPAFHRVLDQFLKNDIKSHQPRCDWFVSVKDHEYNIQVPFYNWVALPPPVKLDTEQHLGNTLPSRCLNFHPF